MPDLPPYPIGHEGLQDSEEMTFDWISIIANLEKTRREDLRKSAIQKQRIERKLKEKRDRAESQKIELEKKRLRAELESQKKATNESQKSVRVISQKLVESQKSVSDLQQKVEKLSESQKAIEEKFQHNRVGDSIKKQVSADNKVVKTKKANRKAKSSNQKIDKSATTDHTCKDGTIKPVNIDYINFQISSYSRKSKEKGIRPSAKKNRLEKLDYWRELKEGLLTKINGLK